MSSTPSPRSRVDSNSASNASQAARLSMEREGRRSMALIHRCSVLCLLLLQRSGALGDVLQHHNHDSRDGSYVDPLFTRAAARTIHRDPNFHAPLRGPMWAQPLYVSNGPSGSPALIAATDQNEVLALEATSGTRLWAVNL